MEIASPAPSGPSRIRAVYVAFALLAVLMIVLQAASGGSLSAAKAVVVDIVLLLLLGLSALAGWEAKRVGRRPAVAGMYGMLVYSVPTAISTLVIPPPMAQIMAAIRAREPNLNAVQVHAAATSFVHVGVLVDIVGFVLLGLLLGWIGSLFYHRPPDREPV